MRDIGFCSWKTRSKKKREIEGDMAVNYTVGRGRSEKEGYPIMNRALRKGKRQKCYCTKKNTDS